MAGAALRFAPVLLVALAIGEGYAAPGVSPPGAKGEGAPVLVWPLPPDPPRIQYLDALRGSGDFKKKPGFWKKLLLGADRDPGVALRKPYGVATDSAGRVYVTDTGLGTVVVFDSAARAVRLLGQKGQVRLQTPIGIALDARDRVFVSDADLDRVFCFGEGGEVRLALGADQKLQNPAGIAIDRGRGRLYVADSHLHRIFVYGTDGGFVGAWGKRGSGKGEFNFPTNLALDRQGNLYVVDTGNFRVQVLDPEGRFLSMFGEAGDAPGRFHRPKGIALDSEGNLYVADAAFNNFQVFDPAGKLLLFVGVVGKEPGQFWLPAGIAIDGSDRIRVVDQVNARVQVFQYLKDKGAGPPSAPPAAGPGSARSAGGPAGASGEGIARTCSRHAPRECEVVVRQPE